MTAASKYVELANAIREYALDTLTIPNGTEFCHHGVCEHMSHKLEEQGFPEATGYAVGRLFLSQSDYMDGLGRNGIMTPRRRQYLTDLSEEKVGRLETLAMQALVLADSETL
jgi:hypothetical protein